ncbi:hypothetical protein EVAR_16663_1 [Eumeta japonica]|uniref:Uncharacterized protein n=1 Tax=Eumeta variegata TaxID=151549 RepID=A0A4C1UZI1_EUMVA|nr:hypothetical protein EVAR_16663_1 [Eumeta japonica]
MPFKWHSGVSALGRLAAAGLAEVGRLRLRVRTWTALLQLHSRDHLHEKGRVLVRLSERLEALLLRRIFVMLDLELKKKKKIGSVDDPRSGRFTVW